MTTPRNIPARWVLPRFTLSAGALLAALLAMGSGARGQGAASPASAPAPATQPAATTQATAIPHLKVDVKERFVDIEARVIVRDAKWLELLACTPKSREHESLLTVDARPSHIHLALLMLGLEPGNPLSWKRDGEKTEIIPPRGPRLAVTLRYEKDGKTVEVPANTWIVNQKTHEVFADNIWLFAGSKVVEYEGQTMYLADANGTAIALVNFGDDLLTRDTKMTNQSDDATWGCNTEQIPTVGTAVTIRIRPVDPPGNAKAGAKGGATTKPAGK